MQSLILSPIVGFFAAFTVMIAIFWITRRARPARLSRVFRRLQMLSAGFMALSHGSNDAQKTMGIITMSLVAYGAVTGGPAGKFQVPLWVIVACATANGHGHCGPAASASSRRWAPRSSTSSPSTASRPRRRRP